MEEYRNVYIVMMATVESGCKRLTVAKAEYANQEATPSRCTFVMGPGERLYEGWIGPQPASLATAFFGLEEPLDRSCPHLTIIAQDFHELNLVLHEEMVAYVDSLGPDFDDRDEAIDQAVKSTLDAIRQAEVQLMVELGRPCTFQLLGPFAGSPGIYCEVPATTGVIDPDTEKVLLRCEEHRGLLQDMQRHTRPGEVVTAARDQLIH